MLRVIIGAVIGAVIAALITITVENLRRPNLELSIETPSDQPYESPPWPAKNMRALRVTLTNKPLPSWARWMLRAPALQCRGTITFHHLAGGQNIFGRTMDARWAHSPEPIPIQAVTSDGKQISIFDPMRFTVESRIDVYPGESEPLDVGVRLDDDEESYGWNNESYLIATLWRNPKWKLPRGDYLVKVEVTSSGQKCVGIFRLINEGLRTDFRLEPAQPEDHPM